MPVNIWNEREIVRKVDYQRPWYSAADKLFSSILFPNAVVVEVGSGCGEFAHIIFEKNNKTIRYLGFDGNPSNAGLARSSFEQDFSVANFEEPLPAPSFIADIVVCLEVIEHIANAELLLSEIHRILKPDGYLILSTPNAGFIGSRLNYLFKGEVLQEGIHLRFFNQFKLMAITHTAGLNYVGQSSCMPWFVYNTIVRMLGLGVRRYGRVPQVFESLFATNFVWLLVKQK